MSPTRRSFIKTGSISLAALGLPRLAKGEITSQEYDEIMKKLSNS